MKTIYLAGGCFWGVEKYFEQFDGVLNTEVGYANGNKEDPTYQEVRTQMTGFTETLKLDYDPEVLPLLRQTAAHRHPPGGPPRPPAVRRGPISACGAPRPSAQRAEAVFLCGSLAAGPLQGAIPRKGQDALKPRAAWDSAPFHADLADYQTSKQTEVHRKVHL